MNNCAQHNWSNLERPCPVCRMLELRAYMEFMKETGATRVKVGDVEIDMSRPGSAPLFIPAWEGGGLGLPPGAAAPGARLDAAEFAAEMRARHAAVATTPAPGSPAADMVAGIVLDDENALRPEDQAEVDAYERWVRTGQHDG